MANNPTEYSQQELKNLSADVSVSPPIPREGMMGKASDGSWYNLKVNTDGELISTIKESKFETNDIEDAGSSVTYIGKEDAGGEWWLVKIDASGSPITIQHASITTDSARTTYSLAWTNRATLSYTDYAGAF